MANVLFRDLKRFVDEQQEQSNQEQHSMLDILRGKPFWIWGDDKEQHRLEYNRTNGKCCSQHILGLPTKGGVEMPMFPYEELIYNTLQDHKLVYILKSSGLGVSEFFLRYIVYLCTRNDDFRNSQICIVVGPNQDLAIKLIRRLKALFEPKLDIVFTSKETALTLNGCAIEAYPSNHLSAMRSLTNPKLIFIDECAFFHPQELTEVRDVAERYLAKSSPYIILVSTPNRPGDLMEQISQEPEETCIYRRLYLDYTYGLGYIYSQQEIDNAKRSGSFSREYDLKFLGQIGNVFSMQHIDAAIEMGKKYDPDKDYSMYFGSRSIGVDPGYGSSAFGVVVTQWQDSHIQILHAEEYHRPDFNEMIDIVYRLVSKYQVDKTYVDGANPSFIKSLKIQIGEEPEYDKVIANHRTQGWTD